MIEESLWSLPWAGVPQGHHHPLPPGSTRRGRLGCRRGRYSHRVLTTALLLPALAAAPQGPQHPVVPEAFDPIRLGDKEGHESDAPFFPAADLDPGIPDASVLLGQPVGSRIARHDEVLRSFGLWAQLSDRMTVHEYGRTHEGRPLVYAVVTSPANHERLDAIRTSIDALADPRGLDAGRAAQLVERTPAIAWMGYSIHGDETSGTDAALAVAHRLVAGRDEATLALLEQLVVVVDPCMNPDGRERIAGQVEQAAGRRVTLDPSAMQRGRWPYGRGNHYLFDMNRDWMVGACPETRGRWRVNLALRPQLFVDAHEMSGLDTFLMYPQSAPRHPELPGRLLHWQGVLADAHGEAFDAEGWGYYTREWADAWYPGYSDAWGSLSGAIGMLYEQGRQSGQPLERESGEIVPYREAVHGQVVASWSNLESLARHRQAILTDFLAYHRSHVDGTREGSERALFFPVDGGERLLEVLLAQGVEVHPVDAGAGITSAVSALGERQEDEANVVRLLGGPAWCVPATQPRGGLVRAFLDFDPRIDPETVADERARLERGDSSRLYDVTAWDLGRQLVTRGEAWWGTPSMPLAEALIGPEDPRIPTRETGVVGAGTEPAYAFAISVDEPRFHAFLARAFEAGIQVHMADRTFRARGSAGYEELPRGSLLIRAHENGPELDARIARVAEATGTRVLAVEGGRAPDLEAPDLGGQHFTLLHGPRIALVSGEGVSTADFGHVWQYLDEEVGAAVTLLEGSRLGGTDLRAYDVLVLPPGRARSWVTSSVEEWVRAGGTLVAIGSAATALAADEDGIAGARRRRDVLEDLDRYDAEVARLRRAGSSLGSWLDDRALYGDGEVVAAPEGDPGTSVLPHTDDDPEVEDAWRRRFMPAGVVLRTELDHHHWLTVGAGEELPVHFAGSTVLLSEGSVPARFAASERVRLGGLLWPEARRRVADSAWLTQASAGRGQVVLFASSPVYRGGWRRAARLLGNAVLIGPGAGADPDRRR